MHCASVEERPFRAASERAERGALAPECSSPALRSPVNYPVSFYSVILSEAKNPCTAPPWKSGPSRPRQSDRTERGFSPRVLLAGPAEPRQPPVSFYSVILSEAKDPMPVGAPFDYCREFSPPGAACPARRAFCECVGFAVRHTVLAALITVKLWSPTPLSPSHKSSRSGYTVAMILQARSIRVNLQERDCC